ncbi:MAG: Hsp20/alpha crystallin family protein [Spiribacter salinus]|uniref:Hsp20/alpha crystallin family protein n=1 Tax=Spiribacter salinus TaxID=1335746 RepID=A0A540VNZ4_9GAMM|nr:MAG: Hsp20/alpha crystallin family protein [Spiribacter salinus]
MAHLHTDPFAPMRRLQQDLNRNWHMTTARDFPAVNIWQAADSVAVTAELPGVSAADIDLQVKADVLTISGARRSPSHDGEIRRHSERAFGRFGRLVRLPYRVDREKVEARFCNGILEIELHRPEEDMPRRIEVKAG